MEKKSKGGLGVLLLSGSKLRKSDSEDEDKKSKWDEESDDTDVEEDPMGGLKAAMRELGEALADKDFKAACEAFCRAVHLHEDCDGED